MSEPSRADIAVPTPSWRVTMMILQILHGCDDDDGGDDDEDDDDDNYDLQEA